MSPKNIARLVRDLKKAYISREIIESTLDELDIYSSEIPDSRRLVNYYKNVIIYLYGRGLLREWLLLLKKNGHPFAEKWLQELKLLKEAMLQEPKELQINWFNNLDKVEKKEISCLAILETCFAIVITGYLAFYYERLSILVIWCVIAPIMLLKTEDSKELCLKWTIQNIIKAENHIKIYRYGYWRITMIAIFAIVYRVIATFIILCKQPLITIKNIPQNWQKQVLSVDLCCTPELVPGYEKQLRYFSLRSELHNYRFWILCSANVLIFSSVLLFSYLVSNIFSYNFKIYQPDNPMFWLACIIFFSFLSPLFYRWSLKSTSWVWFPLLWIVSDPYSREETVDNKLEAIVNKFSYKIQRYFSTIMLFLMLVILLFKCILNMPSLPSLNVWWQNLPEAKTVNIFLQPTKTVLWQLTFIANSLLTFLLFFIAKNEFYYLEKGKPISYWGKHSIQIIPAIKKIFTTYIILCSLVLYTKIAWKLDYHMIDFFVFSW